MYGRVVGNRYQIGDRLGGGGMAVVYQGRDLELGRDVAVKILRGQLGTDEDFIRRFRREAQNAASLSHPNIVQIYDVGQDNDVYYIVLELVEGRSLKEVIQQQGPLPVLEACRIAREILSALSHAHQGRIVHRDIKPHNILIARDGRVKVTDFGIARATTTDTVTHTGSIMGSAHYFSPEQADGKVTGEKSDLYSLGIVLYEMVTGTVPFQGESPITVAIKHLRDRPTPPSYLNGEVPIELDRIILRALEKDPNDRFASTFGMSQALQEFMDLHSAGKTRMPTGDFPTMDMRSLKTRSFTRDAEEPEEEPDAVAEQEALRRIPAARVRSTVRPRERRSRAGLWVGVVALIVMLGLGAGAWAVLDLIQVPDVQVPDVTNLPITRAEDQLKAAGLRHKTVSEQHSDLPSLHVIRTDPPGGSIVKLNREIELIISKGPEAQALQDVRGLTEDEARVVILNQRFQVGTVNRQVHPTIPEGRVIETTPQAGTEIRTGAVINLLVSSGPLRVPNIVGMSLRDAQVALEALGLVLKRGEYRPDSAKPRDTVLATDPTPGTRVQANSVVTVVLAEGPTGTAKPFRVELTVPRSPDPNSTATQVDFQVILVDFVGGVPQDRATNIGPGKRQVGSKVSVEGTYFDERAYLKVLVDNVNVLNEPVSKSP